MYFRVCIGIVSVLIILALGACAKNLRSEEIFTEDAAAVNLAEEIYLKKESLIGKRLAVFAFTNLEGKETNEGKRLSAKLLERLVKKGGLKFIERSELDKILKAQGIEHSGLVDQDTKAKIGKIYNIDIMLNGSISHLAEYSELAIKGVNIQSGEIHVMATVKFKPADGHAQKDDPTKIQLNQQDPDKLRLMNITYDILQRLYKQMPLGFLLAVTQKNDPELMEAPELVERLKHHLRLMRNNDKESLHRLKKLKKGLKLLQKHDKERYAQLMQMKKNIIAARPR